MSFKQIATICIGAFALLISDSYATVDVPTKTYILNTSLSADEYLKSFCAEQKADMLLAMPTMIEQIPIEIRPAAERVAMKYWDSGAVPEPYRSEIAYLSQCSGLPLRLIVTANLVYDLIAFCTSIVCVTPSGQILHARNQDFPVILRNNTINVMYVDAANNTLYEATTFGGYVGVPTGIKFDAFSITINARYDIYGWENWFQIDHKERFPSGWLVRECLMKDSTFEDAVARLSDTSIQAPIYYIIAGTDGSLNGAVITRNQTEVNGPSGNMSEPWYLRNSEYGWYLVETNFDYWKQPGDDRREHVVSMMDALGQKEVSLEGLYKVLSTPPVLAVDTVYTALMQPSNESAFRSIVRFDTNDSYSTTEFRII